MRRKKTWVFLGFKIFHVQYPFHHTLRCYVSSSAIKLGKTGVLIKGEHFQVLAHAVRGTFWEAALHCNEFCYIEDLSALLIHNPVPTDCRAAHSLSMASKRILEAPSSSSSTSAPKRIRGTDSSSSSTSRWNYDIFLGFRGEDTRYNFTDHLYTAFLQKGFRIFRDDNELRRGENISSELLTAIEQSRIAIIVFSRNYASSRWCLNELVKILDCKKTLGQTVIPVFYDVDPSDVRKQNGTLAEAFARHEEQMKEKMEQVKKWRRALTEAANLSGWDLRNIANGYESKFIQKIVSYILIKLNQTPLYVAKYPVGIDSFVQYIYELLYVRSDDVRIVGIYGMGGIGKTTIAKAVYNHIFLNFDGSSFLANVAERSLQMLQEQLLSDVLMEKKVEISNIDRGINIIKERLCSKSVLVVLDDADGMDQLNALIGIGHWFGLGSKIIVTTRDEHLLDVLEVKARYKVEEFDKYLSLQLFSWHAFGQDHPKEDYRELTNAILACAEGLPLVLEVWGSFLCKRSIPEWKSELEKLQRIPDNGILDKLRISYDALRPTEKALFLDIACFFIGMDKNDAIRILDSCGYYIDIGICILVQRSLIRINGNHLWMHNMIQDMGREIVHQESPKEPGKRSRLWVYEEVVEVLTKNTGTKEVEGLVLNLPRLEGVKLSIKAFENMENLKLLQVKYVQLTRSYGDLFKETFPFLGEKLHFSNLRWLCWHGFNLNYIPDNFHLENLVILDMQDSKFKQVWKGDKLLRKLKVLNLSNSRYLTRTTNFLRFPNLERLMLEGCTNLTEIDQQIGCLHRLVFLNLRDCKNLCNLPRSICELKSLEEFVLVGCSKLDQLPDDLGNIVCLRNLLLDETAIKQLPQSIVHLKNLEILTLCGCKGSPRNGFESITLLPSSLLGLYSLKSLSLRDCNLSEGAIPSDIGSLSSLLELDLGLNNFVSLPFSISRLPQLKFLNLGNCSKLQILPKLPPSIIGLDASNCISMERLPNLSNLENLHVADFSYCNKRIGIEAVDEFESMPSIKMERRSNLASAVSKKIWELVAPVICFPGSEIPEWFSHQTAERSLVFELHPSKGCKNPNPKMILCIVYTAHEHESGYITLRLTCKNPGDIECQNGLVDSLFEDEIEINAGSGEDHIWLRYYEIERYSDFKCEDGCRVEFKILKTRCGLRGYDRNQLRVKKCGVHVVDNPSEFAFDPRALKIWIDAEKSGLYPLLLSYAPLCTLPGGGHISPNK